MRRTMQHMCTKVVQNQAMTVTVHFITGAKNMYVFGK